MLRITQNNSPSGAKSYFSSADYYSEGQELVGQWRGQGAERLGLSGEVQQPDWDALCDNRNPQTGKTLTVRRKEDRRVGYDFTFDVPKSVSLLYAMTRDERVLEAFQASVNDTMEQIEAEMKARVRKDGENTDRVTGNMVWGEYIHFTTRPVHGVPDPHLHCHCFAFNTTFDEQETNRQGGAGRWKAGQFGDLKRDAPYFQALHDANLARRLEELGLRTERTAELVGRRGRTGWQLAGFDRTTLADFSRRTRLIEQQAGKLGITDPAAKSQLGAKTRVKKDKELSFPELQALWAERLSDADHSSVETLHRTIGSGPHPEDPEAARDAVSFAIDHAFTRSSTVPERTLLASALNHGVGRSWAAAVADELARRELIRVERGGRTVVTTPAVLAEEKRMLDFARWGRGVHERLGRDQAESYTFVRQDLSVDQQRAVRHVLCSRDAVTVVRGAAGVGKTTAMRETIDAIEQQGTSVFVFAPSSEASRGQLREVEKFAGADTVARLLVDQRLQAELNGQAIWIDEAGLLSSKDMAAVFDIARRENARVILSGDKRQHAAVERGSPLRLLETEAGLIPAEIKEIQRQQGDYKALVMNLSEGRVKEAFSELDRLGWIQEVPEEERYQHLASDYVAAVEHGQTALVVSPTHVEGDRVTAAIRAQLRERGKLGEDERAFKTLTSASLTEAQRRDPLLYHPGDALVFNQNAKGFTRGQCVEVQDRENLPLGQAARYDVFRPGEVRLAAGDLVRITRNGTTLDKQHALHNGAVYSVDGFTPRGDLIVNDGWVVSKDYGHLSLGYTVTSYASQGKSVDRVFIGQSAASFPASSREQFYVSVSRGRKQATIYTDHKEDLLRAVTHSDERLTATELVLHAQRERGVAIIRGGLQREAQRRHDQEQAELQRRADRDRQREHEPREVA